MPLADPEPIIAFMREQGKRDLAIAALVASMVDSEDEAIERLNNIAAVMREHRKTIDRRKSRSMKVNQLDIIDSIVEMAPRLAGWIQQAKGGGRALSKGRDGMKTANGERTRYGVSGATAWVRKGDEHYVIAISEEFKIDEHSWRGGYREKDLTITERPEDGGTISDEDLLWMAMDAFLDAYGDED